MSWTGLTEFMGTLDEAKKAISSLEGEITTVPFDVENDDDFEKEIEKMNVKIDERVETWKDNDMVKPLVADIKEKFKTELYDRRKAYFSAKNQD